MNRSRVTGDLASHGNIFVDIANDRVGIGSTIPGQKLSLPDSAKIALGNSADLSLFHDGSNAYFTNISGTIHIQGKSGENSIRAIPDGAVELYHNNAKKFETRSDGANLTGTLIADGLTLYDNEKLQIGNNNDIQLFHDGTNSLLRSTGGDLQINSGNSAGNVEINLIDNIAADTRVISAKFIKQGSVELYENGSKKFETTTSGVQITGTATATTFSGSGASLTNLNGSNIASGTVPTARLGSGTASSSTFLRGDSTFAVVDTALVADTSPQLGGTLDANNNNIHLGDNVATRYGSSQDFDIYHSGTNGIIDNNTGDLILRGDADDVKILSEDDIVLRDNDDSTNFIHCINGGAVELYHNGAKKFETTSGGATVTGKIFADALDMGDDERVLLGTSDDLQVYHDGSNSYLKAVSAGTGDLYVFADGKTIYLRPKSGEDGVKIVPDAQVELYFNNSKKLETVTGGVYVYGDLGFGIGSSGSLFGGDNRKILLGSGNDLQLFHDGGNSYIQHGGTGDLYIDTLNNSADMYIRSKDNLHLRTNSNAQESVVCVSNGGVILYNAGNQRFTTNGDGVSVTGDVDSTTGTFKRTNNGTSELEFTATNETKLKHLSNGQCKLSFVGYNNVFGGSIDAQTNSGYIRIKNGADEQAVMCRSNGAVELYHDNEKVLETQANGVKVLDSNAANVQIELHDSSGYTGGVYGVGTNFGLLDKSGNWKVKIYENAQVELYHHTHLSFFTRGNGVTIGGGSSNVSIDLRTDTTHRGSVYANSGNQIGFLDETGNWAALFDRGSNSFIYSHLLPSGNNTYDLGSSSYRWRNVYTNDLNLSNEGGVNDVDGTWGSYTIQEGEDDLFLINKRSGKKYKFNLTEVS